MYNMMRKELLQRRTANGVFQTTGNCETYAHEKLGLKRKRHLQISQRCDRKNIQ